MHTAKVSSWDTRRKYNCLWGVLAQLPSQPKRKAHYIFQYLSWYSFAGIAGGLINFSMPGSSSPVFMLHVL